MKQSSLLTILGYCEPCVCLATIVLMGWRAQLRTFRMFAFFLSARSLSSIIYLSLFGFFANKYISVHNAYVCWFYAYWTLYALEAMTGLGMVYDVYRLAMAPLPGLQKLGMLMFRWAAGIASAVAVGLAFGPHITGREFFTKAVTQFQQTQSILTLCLLLFVLLAVRPMGLSYRSKVFGVSLGLGVLACSDLVASAWLPHQRTMYSVYSIINGLMFFVSIGIWLLYFGVPEPKRRMIVLPTTSPFLRWNQISLVLGDDPGYVAVGGVDPGLFAPAEVEIMRRASAKMDAAHRPENTVSKIAMPVRLQPSQRGTMANQDKAGRVPKVKFISL